MVEKRVQFKDGHLALIGFTDRETGHEYVQGPSDVLRFTWNSQVVTGQSATWILDGAETQRLKQGELLLRLKLHTANVAIIKSYLLYPKESIIQEWLQVINRSPLPATLIDPTALLMRVLQREASQIDFTSMSGAREWRMYTEPLRPDSQVFAGSGSSSTGPIQVYFNRSTKTGIFVGWDCLSSWRGVVGNVGAGPVQVEWLANYDGILQPSDSLETAPAFTGTFHGDLDDLGHRMLDYQYRYKWDYTRAPYFPDVLMKGYWATGSSYGADGNRLGGKFDPTSTYRKIFHLTDMFRTVGNDVYWRDNGWWDNAGDWNGPDFAETNRYLSQYSMQQLISIPIDSASGESKVAQEHPDWGGLLDQSNPAVIDWELRMLESKRRQWGNFVWGKDWFAIAGGSDKALRQDQGFRRLLKMFLDRNQEMAYQGCAGGGLAVTYEMLRFAVACTLSDGPLGPAGMYYASYIFPPDKIEDLADAWDPKDYNKATWRGLLQHRMAMVGATEDPAKLDGVRALFDLYHYLAREGVVGRWVWFYHPAVKGDSADRYLQRLSNDHKRGMIVIRRALKAPVTVYPKGLLPNEMYNVSFQESTTTDNRLGGDLMMHGISLPSVADGELIYLNLPLHPGNVVDHIPPTSPTRLTQEIATHMDYSGVELRWNAGQDNSWVSYYQVARDGVPLAKVAKGTYYFDHALGADLAAHYTVATVDGSGNSSAPAVASNAGRTRAVVVDDTSTTLLYTGSGWEHQAKQWSVAYRTLSRTKTKGDAVKHTFTGSRITWYGRMGRGNGVAAVYLDGKLDRLVNTFSADEIPNVALYSRVFPAVGKHTIEIVATGAYTDTVKLWDSTQGRGWVTIDGLQAEQTSPRVVGSMPRFGITYRGLGWQHIPAPIIAGMMTADTPAPASTHAPAPQVSLSDVSMSSLGGDRAEYTFIGHGITWVGRRCSTCGIADVYVDGRLETSVEMFAPALPITSLAANEPRNIPLFTRRWIDVGRHTIAIVVRLDANLLAKGHSVWIDALHVEP